MFFILLRLCSVFQDPVQIQWPAAFGFDGMGGLIVVTNRFQRFLRNNVGLTGEPTYRVLRASLNVRSYQDPPGPGAMLGSTYSRGITGTCRETDRLGWQACSTIMAGEFKTTGLFSEFSNSHRLDEKRGYCPSLIVRSSSSPSRFFLVAVKCKLSIVFLINFENWTKFSNIYCMSHIAPFQFKSVGLLSSCMMLVFRFFPNPFTPKVLCDFQPFMNLQEFLFILKYENSFFWT